MKTKKFLILSLFLAANFWIGYLVGKRHEEEKNIPIQEGFIYQQTSKEDGSQELIAYPTKDWKIIHK